jgi:hypothetical protein
LHACRSTLEDPLIIGKQEMNNIDQGLAPVGGGGLAQVGYILGIVSLTLWVVGTLAWLAAFSTMWAVR